MNSKDILKQAILLERRGLSFYKTVAEQTNNENVKEIFEIMAEEERLHEEYLSKQFKHYEETGSFEKESLPEESNDSITDMVLSDDMKKSIEAASYEAAAISAAIDMETRAIDVYSKQAENANDKNEKELFQWLADWEKTHHKMLFELDEDLKKRIWQDNNFWPF